MKFVANYRRRTALTLALVTVASSWLALPRPAEAACGCPSGGVPEILGSSTKGNDLGSLRGHCAPTGATVELQVMQQHFAPKRANLAQYYWPFWSTCINGCQWISIASTTADPVTGHFAFNNLDQSQSVQLVSPQPSVVGLDGVATHLRVRTWLANQGRWSSFTEPPVLEAFDVAWNGNEGAVAYVESRIVNATRMHVGLADGPDDGDQLGIPLDVDEDTPNFWLQSMNGTGTVSYSLWAQCDIPGVCPPDRLMQQSPAITVNSPPLGRSSEYPFVIGMTVASRPGTMLVATRVLGPRNISDIEIHVDVDVDVEVDVDIGFDFFGLF